MRPQDALLLCRTPLQARICLKIIEVERLAEPDVLYLTQDDSATDRLYVERLRAVAGYAQYLYVEKQRVDILNHAIALARLARRFRTAGYRRVYLASAGSPVFRSLVRRHRAATLVTFDDGAANILRGGPVHRPVDVGRMRLYARVLRLPAPAEILARSTLHYTLYSNFDNVVPSDRLRSIEVFAPREANDAATEAGPTYFIGQPIAELLPADAVGRVRRFLRTRQFDYYVPHPREGAPLAEATAVLDKRGEVAEVAIMASAGRRRPQVFSLFSTVLFNLSDEVADKVYISVPDAPGESERVQLVRRAGCSVLLIDDAAAIEPARTARGGRAERR